jgi:hypothetical protein
VDAESVIRLLWPGLSHTSLLPQQYGKSEAIAWETAANRTAYPQAEGVLSTAHGGFPTKLGRLYIDKTLSRRVTVLEQPQPQSISRLGRAAALAWARGDARRPFEDGRRASGRTWRRPIPLLCRAPHLWAPILKGSGAAAPTSQLPQGPCFCGQPPGVICRAEPAPRTSDYEDRTDSVGLSTNTSRAA